jgi:hypothetical protein
MGNGDLKNMKVREGDLKRARRINFGDRFCDWKILDALISFCEDYPKEFEKWKNKKKNQQ